MLNKLNKYGGFNSYDMLKAIAIVAMIVDHVGLFFYPDIPLLRIIGRASYPLFAFCLGYNQKYKLDSTLIVLAIIMCLTHVVLWPDLQSMIRTSILKASILPSIIILRFSMQYIEKTLNSQTMYLWAFVLWFFAFSTNDLFQYGTAGIILAICGYLSASLNNNRSLSKFASVEGFAGESEHRTRVYTEVHEDSSTESTYKSPTEVELPKRSNQEYKTFLYTNLILYAGFEAILFKVDLLNFCILSFEFFIVAKMLKDFTIQPVAMPENLSKISLLFSRNALIIYFVHSEIFKLLGVIS